MPKNARGPRAAQQKQGGITISLRLESGEEAEIIFSKDAYAITSSRAISVLEMPAQIMQQ